MQRLDIQLFGNHCQRLFGQVFIGESCIRIKCEIPQDFFGRLFIALVIERERLVDEPLGDFKEERCLPAIR